jgi:tetratricopeptide (TPR) repeat protein
MGCKSQIPNPKSQVTAVISFCILFYLIALSASSNIFVLIGATMAERFLFTPSLAFCIVIALLFCPSPKGSNNILSFTLSRRDSFGTGRGIALLIVLALYSYKTFSRNTDWKDNLTLFANGVEICPNSYRTNVTYAWESVLAGQAEQDPEKKRQHMLHAVTYYQKGLDIYDQVQADWYNYGVSLGNLGKVDESIHAYKRALELKPVHLRSAYNLATIYLDKKDNPNSLKYFLIAYQSDSAFMDVAFKVGVNYQMMGDPTTAIPYYESHFRRNPNDKNVITNLAIAYKSLNNTERGNYFTNLLQKIK